MSTHHKKRIGTKANHKAFSIEQHPMDTTLNFKQHIATPVRDNPHKIENQNSSTKVSDTSKNMLSKRFIEAASKEAQKVLGRRIDNKSISALMIDDVDLGNHSAIVAVGITNEGHESLLGLRIGSTKNEQACHDLLSNLVHRGLQHKNGLLVIIGDSKILAKALRDVFGAKVSVQHCQNQQGAF